MDFIYLFTMTFNYIGLFRYMYATFIFDRL